MNIFHVTTLAIIWSASTVGAVMLQQPIIHVATVAATVAWAILTAQEI
jgi:hypothetical protein